MKCGNCGNEMGREWGFCPNCGSRTERRERDLFREIFSRISREFREMNKSVDREFETFDISPWFKKPKGSGFSIRIVRSGDKEPKIYVKTYGDVDKEKVRKEIHGMLGAKEEGRGVLEKVKRPLKVAPKVMEEPKAHVKRFGGRVIVDIEMPGVKSPSDIDVRDLENSVEVKALAGDKAYFKIITKPPQFGISKQRFNNGVLNLEFS